MFKDNKVSWQLKLGNIDGWDPKDQDYKTIFNGSTIKGSFKPLNYNYRIHVKDNQDQTGDRAITPGANSVIDLDYSSVALVNEVGHCRPDYKIFFGLKNYSIGQLFLTQNSTLGGSCSAKNYCWELDILKMDGSTIKESNWDTFSANEKSVLFGNNLRKSGDEDSRFDENIAIHNFGNNAYLNGNSFVNVNLSWFAGDTDNIGHSQVSTFSNGEKIGKGATIPGTYTLTGYITAVNKVAGEYEQAKNTDINYIKDNYIKIKLSWFVPSDTIRSRYAQYTALGYI